MHMSFWWDCNLGDYFISGVSVNSIASMFLACGFAMILSIIFEGLKVIETKHHQENNLRLKNSSSGPCSDDRNNLLNPNDMQIPIAGPSTQNRPLIRTMPQTENIYWIKIRNVLVFSTNNIIKYLMMLTVMLFNGYLTISVVIGITLGYYIFGSLGFFYHIKSILLQKKEKTLCSPDCEENENGTTPPLISGRASSNNDVQTCEFEVHTCENQSCVSSEDIDIKIIQQHNEPPNLSSTTSISSKETKENTERNESSVCETTNLNSIPVD